MTTPSFFTTLRERIARDELDAALKLLRELLAHSPKLDEALHQAGRFENIRKQIRQGTVSPAEATVSQNQIRAALLDFVREIETQGETPALREEVEQAVSIVHSKNVVVGANISAGGDIIIGDNNNINPTSRDKNPHMVEQKHSGSGDYVAGNKIGKQINMGAGSIYNEYNNEAPKKEETSQNNAETPPIPILSEHQKLPETPSGVVGTLLGWVPKSVRPIIAVALLGLIAFVAYHYFMPQKEEIKKVESPTLSSAPEKVYISGIIHINNGEPKPNEIKRMTLRNIDANPAHFDASGRFTFSDVKIPANMRILVDVTFFDGKTVPTQELIVGEADKETKTVRLPDLYVERPKPATKNSPAKGWTINISHYGNGDINTQIQK